MLGKNNYDERLRKMDMQAKQDHFSIRKLNVGVASVLLGFTFLGLNNQVVKADTTTPAVDAGSSTLANQTSVPDNPSTLAAGTDDAPTKQAATAPKADAPAQAPTANSDAKNTPTPAKQPRVDLSTYHGLKTFLQVKDGKKVNKDKVNKDVAATTSAQSVKVAPQANEAPAAVAPTMTNFAATPAQSAQPAPTPNDANGQAGSGTSAATDQPTITDKPDQTTTKPQLPTAKDPQDNQQPTTAPDPNGTKPLTPADQDQNNKMKIGVQDDNGGKTAQVNNWNDYLKALADITVTEIDITGDFDSPTTSGVPITYIASSDANPRNLLIVSKDGRHKIDYRGTSLGCRQKLNITYENLELWCANYYGVINTDGTADATVTFKDIDFHGSQMAHTENNTHYHFKGTNTAETISVPYKGNNVIIGNTQQLLELMYSNNSIDFDEGSTFTGSTYNGTVIEMGSNTSHHDNTVNIHKGATVILNPAKNTDKQAPIGSSEYTAYQYGIYMYGYNQNFNVEGNLQINVGQPDFNSNQPDFYKAYGIYISDNKSNNFNIKTGGQVEVKTNGDIPISGVTNSLIYDGGSFNIDPKGSFKLTGTNMRNYSGTLFMIKGSASVKNGTFEINLTGNGADGAGTNNITLVDVQGGSLYVDNPRSLVLNAHDNTGKQTSIIGTNQITLNNVSQLLEIGGNQLVLPPFTTIKLTRGAVTDTGTKITVNDLHLLNGQRKITGSILNSVAPQYKTIVEQLSRAGCIQMGMTFDEAFKNVIVAVFGNKALLADGYNNIHFTSSNPDGYLALTNVEIKDDGQGGRVISGKIENYTDEKDGPNSSGDFSKILPGGTNAYIGAKFISDGSALNNKPHVGSDPNTNKPYENPYKETEEAPQDLVFATKVNNDGTFSFNISADEISQLKPGAKIELTPYANFISYDPNSDKEKHKYGLDVKDIKDVRDSAAQAIKDAVIAAQNKVKDNKALTDSAKTEFDKAMKDALDDATSPVPTGHGTTSVYDPSASTETEISKRRNYAIAQVNAALSKAMKAITQKQIADAIDNAKKLLPEDAITDATKDLPTVDNVKDIGADRTADQVQTDLDNVKQGYTDAINNAIKQNKDAIKTEINNGINKATSDINSIASDNNLNSEQKDAINGLVNKLDEPKNIAKDGGKIDQDTTAGDVSTDKNKAEADLTEVNQIIDAIKKVEQAAKDQIAQNSGDSDAIKDGLNDAVKDIISGKDTDGSKGADAINKISQNRKAQADAAQKISDAANAAISKINGLKNLDDQSKQNYINAVNTAKIAALAKPGDSGYDAAKSIYAKTNQTDIDTIVASATTSFDKTSAQADLADLDSSVKSFLGTINVTDLNGKIAQAVTDGQKAIAGATADITGALNTAKANVINSLKGLVNQSLIDYEATIETKINGLNLSADAKKDLINNAKAVVDQSKDTSAISQINAAKDFDTIKTAYNEGKKSLDIVQEQIIIATQRADAISKIQQQQAATKADITKEKYKELTDDDIRQFQDQVDQAANTGIATITKETDNTKIDSELNNTLDNINGVITKVTDLNKLKGERQDAIKRLQQKATDTIAIIKQKSDDELSSTQKEQIIQQIQHEEQVGEVNINGSDSDHIGIAESEAEQKIAGHLTDAELQIAKSLANQAVQEEYNKDSETIKNSTLSEPEQADYQKQLDQIRSTGENNINSSKTQSDIEAAQKAAIQGMKDLIAGIKDQVAKDLADAKTNAKTDLDQWASQVRNHINADVNLSTNEKNNYYNDIDKVVADSEQAINSAADKTAVDTALTSGKDNLNQIQANADLQSAKEAAEHDILAKQDEVNKQIDNLASLSSADKEQKKQTVSNIYNQAKQDIDGLTTTTDISARKNQALKAMDDVIAGARDLSETISADLGKLDQVAQDAAKEINQSGLDDQAKQAAITNINNARDKAKTEVQNSTTTDTANAAEADGETAITDAKNAALQNSSQNTLEAAKQKAKNAITEAASAANGRIDKVAPNSEVETNINSTRDTANSAIDKATSEAEINQLETDALNKINQLESSVNLQTAKNQAKAEIEKHVKDVISSLPDSSDKQALIDEINRLKDQANGTIDQATTSSSVIDIKNKTINAIDDLIAAHNSDTTLQDQRKQAKDQLHGEYDGKNADNTTPSTSGRNVIDKINKLALSDTEKQKFIAQAKKALDDANDQLDQATTKQAIEAQKNLGLQNIDQALTDATLQVVKNQAKAQLENDATKAKTDHPDQTAKIDEIVTGAKAKIDDPTTDTNAKVSEIVQDAESKIAGNAADAQKELATAKDQAKQSLKAQAEALKRRVNNDLINNELDKLQSQQLLAEINSVQQKGEDLINSATDQASLSQALTTGKNNLLITGNHITYEERLTDALNQIGAAAITARQSAQNVVDGITDSNVDKAKLLADMNLQIDKEFEKATNAIKQVKTSAQSDNDSDPTAKMQEAATVGVTALGHLTESFQDKVTAITQLAEYAKGQKDALPGFATNPDAANKPFLSAGEVEAGNKLVDTALQQGISDIFGTDTSKNSVANALTAAKGKIDSATYPTQLLAEKNKQLAAIQKFADSANTTIGQNGLDNATVKTLQAQVNAILANTKTEINNVKLTNNDLTGAKNNVDYAEKGTESYKNGENAIQRIIDIAKLQADVARKEADAISNLTNTANDQKSAIDNLPNLTSDEKHEFEQQINDALSDGITNIRNTKIENDDGSPKSIDDIDGSINGTNGSKTTAEANINTIFNNAKQLSDQKATLSDVNKAAADAKAIINNSQLTKDEQTAANKAIDGYLADFEKSGKTADAATAAKTKINAILQPSADATDDLKQYLEDEKSNALSGAAGVIGLSTELGKLTLTDQQKQDYKGNLDTINAAITAIPNKDNIKDATAEYVKGLIALTKLKAKVDLDNAANAAKGKLPSGSSSTDIDNATNAAKGKIDQVPDDVSSTTDRNTIINNINQAEKDGKTDINSAVTKAQNQAVEDARTNAQREIQGQYDSAVKKLGQNDNTNINNAFSKHKDDKGQIIVPGTIAEEIANNKLAIEKEIAKGAVEDAAANANSKVADLKHDDGSSLTETEQQAIKNRIDEDRRKANKENGTIDQSTSKTVEDTRNAAIDAINNDLTPEQVNKILDNDPAVQIERARTAAQEKAQKQYDEAITNNPNAKTKVDAGLDSKFKKDENGKVTIVIPGTTIEDINQNELTAEKEIAKGLVDAAAADVNKTVDSLKHQDGTDYTATEKQAIKNQIKKDQDKANQKDSGTIDQSSTSDAINSSRKDAVDAINNELTPDQINKILDNDSDVKQDRINQAQAEINQQHQDAVNKLHQEYGDKADTSKVDQAFNEHKTIGGTTEKEINDSKIAIEKEIAKGAVDDAATNANNKVDKLKHQDGKAYTDAEKQAIRNDIKNLVDNGKQVIAGATTPNDINDKRNDTLNKIAEDSTADSDRAKDLWDADPTIQREKAQKEVQDQYEDATRNENESGKAKVDDDLKNAGITKDTAGKIIIPGNTADEINQNKIKIEKEIAKGKIDAAATDAKNKVDGLKHQDGTDYTAAEKQAIKADINKIAASGKNAIDDVDSTSVNATKNIIDKRDETLDKIAKDSTADSDEAKKIWDKDPAVQRDRHSSNSSDGGNVILPPADKGKTNDAADNNDKDLTLTKGKQVKIVHNAYLYDHDGKRCNGVIIGSGSVVTTYGIETIDGKLYYVLVDKGANNHKYYLAVGNVRYLVQKLKHNAFVYNRYGQQIKKAGILRKNRMINTYGKPVTIRGHKYFIISNGRYIKADNVRIKKIVVKQQTASEQVSVKPVSATANMAENKVVAKKVMHNAYIYDENGKRSNQLIFGAGSIVNTIGQKQINNRLFYLLENGMYLAASNIAGQKRKLKHNAYLYNQYGNRLGKKTLKKHRLVRTYGKAVKIKQIKFYIGGEGKYIKKANFK